ncbi:MAG: hypothetical protein NC930_01365 [Candidatus Omnitrophica bacterium]|nr:hypothetical protein [Candidatus Omnitrophota bacterium]
MNEYFEGSIRFGRGHLDRNFKICIEKVAAVWQAANGPFPVEMECLGSQTPLPAIFFRKPAVFTFGRLRPLNSRHDGIEGRVVIDSLLRGRFQVEK